MTSRLRRMVLCATAPAVVAADCPNRQTLVFDGPLSLTTPMVAVRAFVDPCAVVQAQMLTPASVYEVSRNQAIQEANTVRDSIGQAAARATGRGAPQARGVEPPVKKPARPPLLTVGVVQTLASVRDRPEWRLVMQDSLAGGVSSGLRRALGANAPGSGVPGVALDRRVSCGPAAMPEVNDAQRIINRESTPANLEPRYTYGPVVQLAALDVGTALPNAADFDTGFVVAAIAAVTPDTGVERDWYPMSTGYTRLGLGYGNNCVYLRHSPISTPHIVASQQRVVAGGGIATQAGSPATARIDRAKASAGATVAQSLVGPGTWTAVVAPASGDSLCNTSTASNAKTLDVVEFGDSPTDSVPRAARFIEGKNMMSFLAVKCASGWCVIGPNPNAEMQPAAHAGAFSATSGPKQGRRTDDALWFDEQHLAVPDPAQPNRLVPSFRASVVPDTGLQNPSRDYQNKWYPMAHVYAPSSPPQKYQDGFGLRTGWNEIRMRQINGIWFAMFVSADGTTHVRDILPMAHTFGETPGTVRFDWVKYDDWVWVPCSDGCCLVQDGRD